jgi:hypothetical protein
MNVVERMKSPTPKFFRILRNVGLAMAAAGAAILASPVALPAGLVAAAGYLTVGGGVLGAVSQATIEKETETENSSGDEPTGR